MRQDTRRIFKATVKNPKIDGRVESLEPGYLVIAGQKIERLEREIPHTPRESAEFFDLGERTILPGFVDTHIHLPQFRIMGTGAGELLSWLNAYTYPEEARFADSDYAAIIADQFFTALLANGTTTAAVYSSVHETATDIAFAAARAKSVRAYIGKVMMDQNSPATLIERTEESLAASIRLFEKWDGADSGRLRYVFTPRFAGSCSMDLMRRVGDLARERNAFVQSHLSENAEEVAWIRQLFPDHDSYAAVYDSAGLLNERSIMGHCIHLSPHEIALLSRTRTNVAFCPYSNRTLRSGTMPYHTLRKSSLHVSLGTDIAGGPSLSMLDQMREAMVAAEISSEEALYLATLAGARALGLAAEIGSFEPGKDADFVVVNRDVVEQVYIRGAKVF